MNRSLLTTLTVFIIIVIGTPAASFAASKTKLLPVKKNATGKPVLVKAPAAATNLVGLIEKNALAKPRKLTDLNAVDTTTVSYSVAEADDLGFAFGSVDYASDRRFFVKNFVHYREFEKDGVKVRYGVGIRWVVNFKTTAAGGQINGFPYIAASATYKTVEASSQFQVVGLNNPKITQLVASAPGELNLETYGTAYATFVRIVDLIDDPKTIVDPELVSVSALETDTEADYADALAQVWALQNIAEKKPYEKAVSSFPNATTSDMESIRKVYNFITGGESGAIPTPRAVEHAKEILKGTKIK